MLVKLHRWWPCTKTTSGPVRSTFVELLYRPSKYETLTHGWLTAVGLWQFRIYLLKMSKQTFLSCASWRELTINKWAFVLFFDGFAVTWFCITNLAWMPERKPWGEFLICINPSWPPWPWFGHKFQFRQRINGYLENPLDPLDPRPSTFFFFYSLFINFGKQYQINVGSPSVTLA